MLDIVQLSFCLFTVAPQKQQIQSGNAKVGGVDPLGREVEVDTELEPDEKEEEDDEEEDE